MRSSLIIFCAGLLAESAGLAAGNFKGRVVTEWLVEDGEDRNMVLLEDFSFTDASGTVWSVPKGWKIDGATIPSFFWSFVGSPYTGDYRRASVIHDYYCDRKNRPWKSVHRLFYEASLVGGVPEAKAKLMYLAVYKKGPRWTVVGGKGFEDPGATVVPYSPVFKKHDEDALQKWVEANNPSLSEIEASVDELEQN